MPVCAFKRLSHMKGFNFMFVETDGINVGSADCHDYVDKLLEAVQQMNSYKYQFSEL